MAEDTGAEVWEFSGALPCPGKCFTTVITPSSANPSGDGRHEVRDRPRVVPVASGEQERTLVGDDIGHWGEHHVDALVQQTCRGGAGQGLRAWAGVEVVPSVRAAGSTGTPSLTRMTGPPSSSAATNRPGLPADAAAFCSAAVSARNCPASVHVPAEQQDAGWGGLAEHTLR